MSDGIDDRVIAHVDMDSFYCQVEHRRLNIARDVPLAVQQWDGLIAVNYPAKALGVHRGWRASAAKKQWPQLVLVHVDVIGMSDSETASPSGVSPTRLMNPNRSTQKACLKPYRDASNEIMALLEKCHPEGFQRASIDEAYVDLTPSIESSLRQLYGIVSEAMRNVSPDLLSACLNVLSDDISENHITLSNIMETQNQSERNSGHHPPPLKNIISYVNSWCVILFKLDKKLKVEDTTLVRLLEQYVQNLPQPSTQSVSLSTATRRFSEDIPKLGQLISNVFAGENSLLHELRYGCSIQPPILRDAEGVEHSLGYSNPSDFILFLGGLMMHNTRKLVESETAITSSAGIGRSKFLVKEVSAKHKPNAQTLIREANLEAVLGSIKLQDARGLRGKTGVIVRETLPQAKTLLDLQQYSLSFLKNALPFSAPLYKLPLWLYSISRGIDSQDLKTVNKVSSMLSCKTFKPEKTFEGLVIWINILCQELSGRLADDFAKHHRLPKTLVVHYTGGVDCRARTYSASGISPKDKKYPVYSKEDLKLFVQQSLQKKIRQDYLYPCTRLGIGAIDLTPVQGGNISRFLNASSRLSKQVSEISGHELPTTSARTTYEVQSVDSPGENCHDSSVHVFQQIPSSNERKILKRRKDWRNNLRVSKLVHYEIGQTTDRFR